MLASASVAALAADSATLTVITPVEGEVFTYEETLKVTMSVKMEDPMIAPPNNAISGKLVTFKVNNASYNTMTNADGEASYTLYGPGPAEYHWLAYFAGDSDYDPVRTDVNTFVVERNKVTVDFTGEDNGTGWIIDGVTRYPSVVGVKDLSDIFGEQAKEMEPGMSASTSIELKNGSRVYSYTFNLLAIPLDKVKSQAEADEFFYGTFFNNDDYPLAKSADLSQELMASIDTVVTFRPTATSREAREIFSGKLDGSGSGMRDVADLYNVGMRGAWLGTLGPSQSGTVTISVTIPETLHNDYQNALCDCKWVVIVSDHLRGPTPEQPEEPVVEVPEVETPLDEPPPEIPGTVVTPPTDIGEDEVPKTGVVVDPGGKIVQTGGIRTFALPLIIILILLCALLAVTYMKRRNEKEGKAAE